MEPTLEKAKGKGATDTLDLMRGVIKQFKDKGLHDLECVHRPINCKHPDVKLGPRLRQMHGVAICSVEEEKRLLNSWDEILVYIKTEFMEFTEENMDFESRALTKNRQLNVQQDVTLWDYCMKVN
jgi:hypothetical protein